MTDQRDYLAEMDEWLTEHLPAGDYVMPALAVQFTNRLKEEDPGLLTGWLMQSAARMIADRVRVMRHADRQKLRRPSRRDQVARAIADFENGNREPLRSYLDRARYKLAGNVIRSLGDLTGADCEYVAASYSELADTHGFEAMFFEVLGRKAQDRTVREVYDDDGLRELRETIRRRYDSITAA